MTMNSEKTRSCTKSFSSVPVCNGQVIAVFDMRFPQGLKREKRKKFNS